jgi:hypothetical protein
MFIEGQVYNRQEDIHASFGGQERGGIATPIIDEGYAVVWTPGYRDAWCE